MRKCKQCRTDIPTASNSTEVYHKLKFCSYDCVTTWGLEDAKKKREKADQAAHKKKKEGLISIQAYAKKAEAQFNKFIRIRDRYEPCISCQRHHEGQYHAGHYRTVAAASQLRFNEDNVHKQCAPCNNHLSGNLIYYRINLIKKIGLKRVEALENNNEIRRYTREELDEIEATYKTKNRS